MGHCMVNNFLFICGRITSPLLAFAIVLHWVFTVGAVQADQRLDLFLQRYEAMKGRNLAPSHPENPFHPYLAKHFEDGLDGENKAELTHAQETGDCITVENLAPKGFLNLYPFLAPAFEDGERGQELWSMLTLQGSAAINRCFDHKELSDLASRRDLSEFPPIDIAADIAYRQLHGWGDPKTDRDLLSSIYFSLGKAAFCHDYPASITDVMSSANRHGGMILTPHEMLYLAERAQAHSLLDLSTYQQTLAKIVHGFSSMREFHQVREASRWYKLRNIKAVTGFWQSACDEIHKIDRR